MRKEFELENPQPQKEDLLRRARAPLFMFHVVDLWERLERHVWTLDGPTGITIRASRQRGLPQGDPLAPWALNLVMATWIWTLPKLDLVRVFLDDCASREILTKHSV